MKCFGWDGVSEYDYYDYYDYFNYYLGYDDFLEESDDI